MRARPKAHVAPRPPRIERLPILTKADMIVAVRYGSQRAGWLSWATRRSQNWRLEMWRSIRVIRRDSKQLRDGGSLLRAAKKRAEIYGYISRIREMLRFGILK
jgi:hypothetical protein